MTTDCDHQGQTGPFCSRCGQRMSPNSTQGKGQSIDARWDEIKPAKWGNKHRGERNMLRDLLEPDERMECLIEGKFGRDLSQMRLGSRFSTGIAVATDKRVLMVDKGILGSSEVVEARYADIKEITYTTGVMFGGITIAGTGIKSLKMELIPDQKLIKPFVDSVRSHL